jgi:hypothetical protein
MGKVMRILYLGNQLYVVYVWTSPCPINFTTNLMAGFDLTTHILRYMYVYYQAGLPLHPGGQCYDHYFGDKFGFFC